MTALAATEDQRLFVSLQNLSQPTEIFVAGEGAPRRVTHFTDAALDRVSLGEVRDLPFEGLTARPCRCSSCCRPGSIRPSATRWCT